MRIYTIKPECKPLLVLRRTYIQSPLHTLGTTLVSIHPRNLKRALLLQVSVRCDVVLLCYYETCSSKVKVLDSSPTRDEDASQEGWSCGSKGNLQNPVNVLNENEIQWKMQFNE